MVKWILIGIGGLVLYNYLQRSQTAKAFVSGNSDKGSGVTGFVDSLSGLTNSIGRLLGQSASPATTVDRDALIKPLF